MYDRGSWEQLWNAHAFVKEEEWEPLHLPRPDEVEGLELEIIVRALNKSQLVADGVAELPSSPSRHVPCQIPRR